MSWPCGTGKKFVRAHARGEKLGFRVRGLLGMRVVPCGKG